ncbi:hypothetical protein FA95DRAFT_1612677 [Auriscalpium vulgare]|uniref:Uncharacterized protein n=1 Tax=Auriscalpium vulgare TaxID=40419 RepID=A0ACB8R598_9AGAM|nr:hypothetical protein FA95DRAFT_1612677 [Auriscalpium vulgare]
MSAENGPVGALDFPPNAQNTVHHTGNGRRYQFYSVCTGSQSGVFWDWLLTLRLVTGYPSAQYKGYRTFQDASAAYQAGMDAHPNPPPEHPASLVFHFPQPVADAAPTDDQGPVNPPANPPAPTVSVPTPVAAPTPAASSVPADGRPTGSEADIY